MEEANNKCVECNKIQEWKMEVYIKAQEESRKYYNTVISLGYASMLVIFSSVSDKMTSIVVHVFGGFFLLSLASFVFYEIFKSINDEKINESFQKALIDRKTLQESLDIWFLKNKELTQDFNKYWRFYFSISLVSGIISGLILLFALFFPVFTEKVIMFFLVVFDYIFNMLCSK